MSGTFIIDISNNQGRIDYAKVAKGPRQLDGIIAKASEGPAFTDSFFGFNRQQTHAIDKAFGAYHFARPTESSGVQQAEHFCSIVQQLNVTDLRPVLDFEESGGGVTWIRDFNDTVKRHLGRYPIFYSNAAIIQSLELSVPVGNGLWLANYNVDDGNEHTYQVPKPWKKVALHQFTSKGRWPGINGDVDFSHGPSLRALRAHPLRSTL